MIPFDTISGSAHTDIRRDIWIEKILPRFFWPYARLARLDRPIGTWLLLLPGLWSIVAASRGVGRMTGREWFVFVLFFIGAFVMRGAGCVINDLWDRKIDAQVERTKSRPLASGEITPAQGLIFLSGLLLIGMAILLQLDRQAIVLGLLSVALVAVYPLAKRVTWYPQFILGLTFNMGALMGWAAIKDGLGLPAFLLYGAGILWTLGYDTIYAHQDKEDDAVIGIKSTALKFGDDSPKWICGFYAGTSVLLLLTGFSLNAVWPFYIGWAAAVSHLVLQLYRWDKNDSASSLRIFRANRNFGLLILISIALAFLRF